MEDFDAEAPEEAVAREPYARKRSLRAGTAWMKRIYSVDKVSGLARRTSVDAIYTRAEAAR